MESLLGDTVTHRISLRRARHEEDFRLVDDVLAFASRQGWTLTPRTLPAQEHLWRYWNLAAVAAASRLLRGAAVLAAAGHLWEAWMLVRSLLELVANQLYIDADRDRVFEFMRRGSKKQQRMAKIAKETGFVNEEDWKNLAATAQRDIGKLRPFDVKGLAFSGEARVVMNNVGLDEAYKLVYAPIGNFVHSNAIAFDFYVTQAENGDLVPDWGLDEDGIEAPLRYGVQYFLGVVELAAIAHEIQPGLVNELGAFHERLRALRARS